MKIRKITKGVYYHFKHKFYRVMGFIDIKKEDEKSIDISDMVYNGQAYHSETKEKLNIYTKDDIVIATDLNDNILYGHYVFYMALYPDSNDKYLWYVRDYDMFSSPVDNAKYPDEKQYYRFEYMHG